MTYNDFKSELFTQAKAFGFSDWEVYYSADTSFDVKIFGGEISEYKNTEAVGLSFRGTYQGRMGYAYTEKLDASVIPELIKNAEDNAGVIEEEEIEKLYPGDKEYPTVESYNPALEAVSSKEIIDMALAMEKYAYGLDSRVKSVDYCNLGTLEAAVSIANSYGLDLTTRSNFAYGFVMVRVEDGGEPKTAHEIWHGNDLSKFSYRELAEVAVNRALSYLNAQSMESASYPVIFDNRTAGSLFEAFSSVFFAEQAQKGFSMLKGKEEEAIAASIVTLRDDGVCKDSFGSIAFDSEGAATKQKAVIENGVLKTLLYNTKSAAKDGTVTTGNGFRPGFKASVGTACTNFYIVPSDTSLEKMQSGIKQGVMLTELAGLHSGLNPVSGDFSVSASGFLIEDGKVTKPVEQITVAGNFYSLLKDIECVGDDLLFDMPSAGGTFGMPSVLVKALPISGL